VEGYLEACVDRTLMTHCDLFCLWARGSWVLGTNVGGKLFVTLGLVLPLHFIQRFADDRIQRTKHPVTLGAAETLKVPVLNPNQLAPHGHIISQTCVKQNNMRRPARTK
jgi:hypothetical protein